MIDGLRKEHVKRYGSFLWCPDREKLCSFMEEALCRSGKCERDLCILDDPEYQKLKERQEKNRIRREKIEKAEREEEKRDPPAPIRTQNKTEIDLIKDEIRRLENESRMAYSRNRPKLGESKLHEAIVLRRKLRRKIG